MPEKTPKPLPVIERLRAQYPGRDICSVAVSQLDDPTEMSQFLIQYAQELGRTPARPETRVHPFDTAVELVDHRADLYGGEIASRWHELIDTGTVQNVPDHSLDWIKPRRKPQVESVSGQALDNLLTERGMIEKIEKMSAGVKLTNIRLALQEAEERRALAKRISLQERGAGLVEAERKLVAKGLMLPRPAVKPSPRSASST